MSDQRFDTAAVVLGMHRSGTSALAGVLALTDFTAPRTLLPSSAVNERGFWESEPVKALNDELFVKLGTTWHSLDQIHFERLSNRRLRSLTRRLETVVSEEFEPGTRPLIKDPRMCRLLPLWRPALEDLSARTVYPITLRSPLEVARSLMQRNEFDSDLGYLLWARYYLDAEFHTRGLPRAWIPYDRLIDDWRASVDALSSEVGIDFKIDSAVEQRVDDFLSAELRHHRTGDEQALLELGRFPFIQNTYGILLDWAHGRRPNDDDTATLDRSRAQFDELSGAMSKIAENARLDRKRVASARAQTDAVTAELSKARKGLDDLAGLRLSQARLEERIESAVASLDESIQQRLTIEQQLSETLLEAARERSVLQKMLAEAQSAAKRERATFKQKLADAARANEALRNEMGVVRAGLEQKLADATSANDVLRNEMGVVRAGLEQKLADAASTKESLRKEIDDLRAREKRAAEDFENKLAAVQSAHDRIDVELKDVKRKYRSTQHQLARDREKLRRTQDQLAQREQTLAAIRGSTVWRSYTSVQTAMRRGAAKIRRIAGGSDRRRRGEQLAMLRESPLFDRDWYVNRYADLAAAGIDPATHYLDNGWREGRDPGPSFSTSAYLRSNADVARAGINPLLHFIEFGYSEGRNVGVVRPSVSTGPAEAIEQFGPAAPCVTFGLQEPAPLRWRRAARLSSAGEGLLVIGGEPIGLATDAPKASRLRHAFDRLALVSGYGAGVRQRFEDNVDAETELRDVWFVSNGRLRSRWSVDRGPTVVRAYQHDPRADGTLTLVGEGLIASAVDFVDANLINPYFPVLFVLSEPDGKLRSAELLAFPSLSRGGLHYPELVAVEDRNQADTGRFDVIGQAELLASRLSGIVEGSCAPFVGKLSIDLAGADGTEPLFRSDFQEWLSTVMQIGVEPVGMQPAGSGDTFLREMASIPVRRRKGGCTVILPADAIPSISVLVTSAASAKNGAEVAQRIAFAHTDPAQPSMLIHLPLMSPAMLRSATPDYVAPWPRFLDTTDRRPGEPLELVAIRRADRRPPTESEMLVPLAQGALQVDGRDQAITWLIFPEDWDSDALRQSLEALALQQGAQPIVSLVGEVADPLANIARLLFNDRLSVAPDVNGALEAVRTPLTGYLGQHVILHDGRTSRVLSALLDHGGVVSASCVLVAAEKRGKGWHMFVADAGTFGGRAGEPALGPEQFKDPLHFWRSTYPALRPPRDLWVGKSESVKGWLQRAGPLRPEEGVQLCTSLVTASYLSARDDRPAHLSPPASAEQRAIRTEVLFG